MNLTSILTEFHGLAQAPPAAPAPPAATPAAPTRAPGRADLEALDPALDGTFPPNANTRRYGFFCRGPLHTKRLLVDWDATFTAHAQCDSYSTTGHEGYLSAFTFDGELVGHYAQKNASPKGFTGVCGAAWVMADFDGPEALVDVRRLVRHLSGAGVDPAGVLCFFSGNKGFHVALHADLCGAEPGAGFNAVARRFWQALVKDAGATGTFDASIYDRQRLLRAPNSRHPKTGLFKRFIPAADFERRDLEEIRALAREPLEFAIPEGVRLHAGLAARWRAAQAPPAPTPRRTAWTAPGAPSTSKPLNRSTVDFIENGAPHGTRALRLFSAAANLAEAGETRARTFELLEGPAAASGLSPAEARRQIECGFNYGNSTS